MSLVCDYFIACQSPYVYLGHARFVALAKEYGVEIRFKPMDLGRVFSTSGGLPLAKRAPQRQAYRLVELKRWSAFLGVPMNIEPKYFPVAGDAAPKLLIAVKQAHGTDAALTLSEAISTALWAQERDVADAATLAELVTAQGLDAAALQAAAQGDAVQAEYDANTEEATALGVYGVPWFQFQGEPYWGQDRLDFLQRAFEAARG